MRGQPQYYSFLSGLSSYSDTLHQEHRSKQIINEAHFISNSGEIELFEIGGEKLWMPRGNLPQVADIIAEQERGIYDYSKCRALPGDIVLDAGAHIGIYARHALRLGASRVVAIEPVQANLQCLRRNLASDIDAGKVIIYPKGIWSSETVLRMKLNPGATNSDSFVGRQDSSSSTEIPVTTLDSMVRELGLTRVDFIKMDIEGSERNALAGAANTIVRFHPRMVLSVYHLAGDPVAIPEAIRRIRTDYQRHCGSCYFFGTIIPQVYFFF